MVHVIYRWDLDDELEGNAAAARAANLALVAREMAARDGARERRRELTAAAGGVEDARVGYVTAPRGEEATYEPRELNAVHSPARRRRRVCARAAQLEWSAARASTVLLLFVENGGRRAVPSACEIGRDQDTVVALEVRGRSPLPGCHALRRRRVVSNGSSNSLVVAVGRGRARGRRMERPARRRDRNAPPALRLHTSTARPPRRAPR